jgi:hypothetical protein
LMHIRAFMMGKREERRKDDGEEEEGREDITAG